MLQHCKSVILRSGLWAEFESHWNSILKSTTDAEYEERVEDFKRRFSQTYPSLTDYVLTFWLEKYKEKIVKRCVNEHTHFSNFTTSRVEGIHAVLKRRMPNSRGNLFTSSRAIIDTLFSQITELEKKRGSQQSRSLNIKNKDLFFFVKGLVSFSAILMVDKQH